MPIVRLGDRFVLGLDAEGVDELLDLRRDESSRSLTLAEIVERATTLLRAALRYARQLPPEHHEHPTARAGGAEDAFQPITLPDGSVVSWPDGRPYIPHPTAFDLFRHIVAHGGKLLYLAEDPDAELYPNLLVFALVGYPDEQAGVSEIGDQVDDILGRLHRWLEAGPDDVERVVVAYDGRRQTRREALQANAYSMAQHTRQLMSMVQDLGIEPQEPLQEADYEGLGVPAAVWA